MPIQIKQPSSLAEVEREILSLETQYEMSSADFSSHPAVDTVVSEFDAVEWDFLLMQKRALEDDRCVPAPKFSGRYVTQVSTPERVDMYDLAA